MSSIKVECVIKEKTEIGESPVWEEKDSSLLYVDITGQRVSRWNSLTSQIESIATGKPEDKFSVGFQWTWWICNQIYTSVATLKVMYSMFSACILFKDALDIGSSGISCIYVIVVYTLMPYLLSAQRTL